MMAAPALMPMVAAFTGLGRELLASRWSLLLIFTIAALFAGLDEGMPISQLIGWFVVCGLGLVPLARMVAEMVEALAEKLGDRIGGLISVVLGNLVELVVSFTALASGLYHLVVISVAGAVITNCLLILGVSTCLAARRQPTIDIHPHSSGLQSQQLLISTIFLAVPTVFYLLLDEKFTDGGSRFDNFAIYSLIVAVLVVVFYLLSFLYQLGTARSLYVRKESEQVLEPTGEQRPIGVIVLMLLLVSLVLVGVSEHLVDSLQMLVDGAHLNPLFVGLFLLPLFGSFSEGLIAVKAATSNRMDLAMTSTVESSVQLLLFVLPLLVICGIPMGRYLHLAIPADALFCLGATVLAVHWITENRKLSWYEGSLLLTLYAVVGMGTLLLGR
jgi:Ca2+:H+ antiporter